MTFAFYHSKFFLPPIPSFSQKLPPLFLNVFPVSDWFGLKFLHRFIFGWHLWRLHFFPNSHPPLPRIPPVPPKPLPLILNTFPLFHSDKTCCVYSFYDVICDVCIFSVEIPRAYPYLFPWFWTLSHCSCSERQKTGLQLILGNNFSYFFSYTVPVRGQNVKKCP